MKSSSTQGKGKCTVKVTRPLSQFPVVSQESGIAQVAPLFFLDCECSHVVHAKVHSGYMIPVKMEVPGFHCLRILV